MINHLVVVDPLKILKSEEKLGLTFFMPIITLNFTVKGITMILEQIIRAIQIIQDTRGNESVTKYHMGW